MKQIKTLHLEAVLSNHGRNMDGKRIVITGTTSGTGYIAARELARLGAEMILLNRHSERAKKSLQTLNIEVPNGKFEQIFCDLQDFYSVNTAINQIIEKYNRIDILINNAGVMALKDKATLDGYDVQMQTNVLSHFLITKKLFPLLMNSTEGRIINHTSQARKGEPLDFRFFGKNGGNLGGNDDFRWERYHQTKLANFVLTYALKEKLTLAGISNVIALVAHPGFAMTNLQITTAHNGGLQLTEEMMNQAQSQEDGATGIIRAAIDPESSSGEFYGPDGFVGYPDIKTPETDLVTPHNIKVAWEGCEAAVGQFII